VKSRIAVNVSPQQFDEPDFIQQVQQALDDSGLSPDLLELEITESAAVSDPDRVAGEPHADRVGRPAVHERSGCALRAGGRRERRQ
jgi:predicted signal transduction protein with EAL and GGDEF domain